MKNYLEIRKMYWEVKEKLEYYSELQAKAESAKDYPLASVYRGTARGWANRLVTIVDILEEVPQ